MKRRRALRCGRGCRMRRCRAWQGRLVCPTFPRSSCRRYGCMIGGRVRGTSSVYWGLINVCVSHGCHLCLLASPRSFLPSPRFFPLLSASFRFFPLLSAFPRFPRFPPLLPPLPLASSSLSLHSASPRFPSASPPLPLASSSLSPASPRLSRPSLIDYRHIQLVNNPTTTVVPAVNQISMGVGGARPEATMAWCAQHNVTVEAYV